MTRRCRTHSWEIWETGETGGSYWSVAMSSCNACCRDIECPAGAGSTGSVGIVAVVAAGCRPDWKLDTWSSWRSISRMSASIRMPSRSAAARRRRSSRIPACCSSCASGAAGNRAGSASSGRRRGGCSGVESACSWRLVSHILTTALVSALAPAPARSAVVVADRRFSRREATSFRAGDTRGNSACPGRSTAVMAMPATSVAALPTNGSSASSGVDACAVLGDSEGERDGEAAGTAIQAAKLTSAALTATAMRSQGGVPRPFRTAFFCPFSLCLPPTSSPPV